MVVGTYLKLGLRLIGSCLHTYILALLPSRKVRKAYVLRFRHVELAIGGDIHLKNLEGRT